MKWHNLPGNDFTPQNPPTSWLAKSLADPGRAGLLLFAKAASVSLYDAGIFLSVAAPPHHGWLSVGAWAPCPLATCIPVPNCYPSHIKWTIRCNNVGYSLQDNPEHARSPACHWTIHIRTKYYNYCSLIRSFTFSLYQCLNRFAIEGWGYVGRKLCLFSSVTDFSLIIYNRLHTHTATSTACNLLFLENKVACTPRCGTEPWLFAWTQRFTVFRAATPVAEVSSRLGSVLYPPRQGGSHWVTAIDLHLSIWCKLIINIELAEPLYVITWRFTHLKLLTFYWLHSLKYPTALQLLWV